ASLVRNPEWSPGGRRSVRPAAPGSDRPGCAALSASHQKSSARPPCLIHSEYKASAVPMQQKTGAFSVVLILPCYWTCLVRGKAPPSTTLILEGASSTFLRLAAEALTSLDSLK